MQLASPAAAFLLGGVDGVLQPLLGHRTGRRHPGRGAGGEGLEHPLVLVVEPPRLPDAVQRHDDAERVSAEDQGGEQGATGLRRSQVHARELAEQHLLRCLLCADPEARHLRVQAAGDGGGRRDDEILALAEQDDQCPGLDQRPPALHDRIQHPLEIGLPAHGDRDVGGSLQAPDRAAQVVAVTSAVGDVPDRRQGHHPLVGCDRREGNLAGELAAVLAPGIEVEVGAHRAGPGSLEIAVPVADMTVAQGLRDQHLHPLADQLVARVAEDGLGPRIDEPDLSIQVDTDNGVGRELEELPFERLARVVRHGASIVQPITGSRQSSWLTDIARR